MKMCSNPACKNPIKPNSEFYTNSGRKDGLQLICKDCDKEKSRLYRNTPHAKRLERQRTWRRQNRNEYQAISRKNNLKPKQRFANAVRRAAVRGLEWSLEFNEWLEMVDGKTCFYCDGKLPQMGHGLDRKDVNTGYVTGNVIPCCARCNVARGTWFSFDEFCREIAPAIRRVDMDRKKSQ